MRNIQMFIIIPKYTKRVEVYYAYFQLKNIVYDYYFFYINVNLHLKTKFYLEFIGLNRYSPF